MRREETKAARIGAALALLPLAVIGCSPPLLPVAAVPPLPGTPPDAVVYLIGDAGDAMGSSVVLRQLRSAVRGHAASTSAAVVFLGDNVYEHGIRPYGTPEYVADTAQLAPQVRIVDGASARAFFVPGNHDWDQPDGAAAIQRQEQTIRGFAAAGPQARLLPADGCPGPHSESLGQTVRLVFLDTEWLLRGPPETPNPACPEASRQTVFDSLAAILESPDTRHDIVLAHHPLETYGPHGGYFGLRDLFFPATNLWKPLYIPVPLLYPIVRNIIAPRQDLVSRTNRELREGLVQAFRRSGHRPLVYAAGHEHGLQVFDGGLYSVGSVLISGAGSRLRPVGQGSALFAAGEQHGERGYMQISVWRDGRALLSVFTDGSRACRRAEGECVPKLTLRFTRWLADELP